MKAQTGVTAQTVNRLIRDAGIVFFNLDLAALETTGLDAAKTGATLLGGTRGGNSFNPGRTFRQMEADGLLGPTKGFVRRETVAPVLTVNPIEITSGNVIKALAGSSGVDTAGTIDQFQKITGGEIANGSYIDNVALITYRDNAGTVEPGVIFVVENALALEAPDFGTSEDDEMVLSLAFAAHFDPASPGVEPWRLYHKDTIA